MKNIFFSLFLLVAGIACANEYSNVGFRPMSEEVLKQFKAANESEEVQWQDSEEYREKTASFDSDYYPPYPNANHWIFEILNHANAFEIEDGSVWISDSNYIQDWLPSDIVVITQNRSWFSSYKYRILNKSKRYSESIAANLSMIPINGEYTLQIINIDYYNGLLILSDHSLWQISKRDCYLFNEWSRGDYIILGINSGWDVFCPFILINANIDNFIRAKQY